MLRKGYGVIGKDPVKGNRSPRKHARGQPKENYRYYQLQ